MSETSRSPGQILAGGRLVVADTSFDGWLSITGDTISEVGRGVPSDRNDAPAHDLTGYWIVPGFVDLHVHGGGGASFGSADPAEAVRVVEFHRRHGTTTTLASLVTGPLADMCAAVTRLAGLAEAGVIAGIHVEGPFLNPVRRGAQDPNHLLGPGLGLLDRLLDAGGGHVRAITIAPELSGGIELIRHAVDRGVIAAVGHTDATYREAMEAFDRGASLATHLFNGMRPFHSREGGAVAAALNHPDVVVEIVNDGVHVSSPVVDIVARLKPGELALVTDAMTAAGAGDGIYPLGGMSVRVEHGIARLLDGSSIAGSTLTMDAALRRAVHDVGMTIEDAVAATSTTPARVLGIAERVGALAAGKRADLVVLDHDLRVVKVMRCGRWLDDSRIETSELR